jgi:hypothetical protein
MQKFTIPQCRDLPEKIVLAQLVQKFPEFYRIKRVTIIFTRTLSKPKAHCNISMLPIEKSILKLHNIRVRLNLSRCRYTAYGGPKIFEQFPYTFQKGPTTP